MYTCLCGGSYKIPQEADDAIGLVTEKNPVVQVIVVCPHCKKKGVKGGEYMYDEFTNEDGEIDHRDAIMMFGLNYDEEKHKQNITSINDDGSLSVENPVFMGIPVVDTTTFKHWYEYLPDE
jgi:hypothetical protein